MNRDPVLIIGAGLAGLAAGRALKAAGRDYLILEGSDRPGGLCRTERVGGFIFDYTGHLLHLRDGASKELILGLVGDRMDAHDRRSSVCIRGTLVDYPVQAHFGALPDPLPGKCLEELSRSSREEPSPDLPFDEWARARFGPTLAGLFMIPYNAKLNVHPLGEMEVSWTSWSVPVPSAAELERIARGEDPPVYGYNATFLYPRADGIEILPRALAHGQEDRVRTGNKAVSVDARKRSVRLENGRELPYSALISTVALPELLRMTGGLPDGLAEASGRLRHSSVLGVCLGLDRPVRTGDHWIYFPDEDLPFYRVGFPSNFSQFTAPAGCGSLYAEAAWAGSAPPDPVRIGEAVMAVLARMGIVDGQTRVVARIDMPIPFAYVFHDRYRKATLPSILTSLIEQGIYSVGRYGAWEYSAMQDAVQWGLDAAGEVLS